MAARWRLVPQHSKLHPLPVLLARTQSDLSSRTTSDTISDSGQLSLSSLRGSINRVPASAGVTAGNVRLCRVAGNTVFPRSCLLYTSDAADEEDRVDLGV